MLKAIDNTRQSIWAEEACKGEQYLYYCPTCSARVRPRQGLVRIAHFAHIANKTNCPGASETEEHREMKLHLFNVLSRWNRVNACDVEVSLGGDPRRRADVWAESDAGVQIAVECQVSTLSEGELQDKLQDYTNLRVYCMYIIHKNALFKRAVEFSMAEIQGIEQRIPRWVLRLHTLYGGRVYVYDGLNGEGRIYPVHFGKVRSMSTDDWLEATMWIGVGEPMRIEGGITCGTKYRNDHPIKGRFRLAMIKDAEAWKVPESPAEERKRRAALCNSEYRLKKLLAEGDRIHAKYEREKHEAARLEEQWAVYDAYIKETMGIEADPQAPISTLDRIHYSMRGYDSASKRESDIDAEVRAYTNQVVQGLRGDRNVQAWLRVIARTVVDYRPYGWFASWVELSWQDRLDRLKKLEEDAQRAIKAKPAYLRNQGPHFLNDPEKARPVRSPQQEASDFAQCRADLELLLWKLTSYVETITQ